MPATPTGICCPLPGKCLKGNLQRHRHVRSLNLSYEKPVMGITVRPLGEYGKEGVAHCPTPLKSSTKLHFSNHNSSQRNWKNKRFLDTTFKRGYIPYVNGTTRLAVC